MQANNYMKKLYQDMQLRGYGEHTQEVYGRVVGKFLNYSGKSIEAVDEYDVRNRESGPLYDSLLAMPWIFAGLLA